jgi:hypothetical protein
MTDQSRPPGPRPFPGSEPRLPPPDLLAAHGAKVLDPATAVVRKGQRLLSTAYFTDRLLVSERAPNRNQIIQLLTTAAAEMGLDATVDIPEIPVRVSAESATRLPPTALRLQLSPAQNRAVAVDAWMVLQHARASVEDPAVLARAGLDHVLLSHAGPGDGEGVEGTPFDEPHSPPGGGSGGASSWTGYAGPYAVAMVIDPPKRDRSLCHRPVVAVVDTGCGQHSWFTEGIDRDLVGYLTPDPESGANLISPMDGSRPRAAGHGTFITGLIRQRCPDADILAVRLLQADGLAAESDMIATLDRIRDLAFENIRTGRGHRVDIVSLSCGHYQEEVDDPFQPMLQDVLHDLGRLGVAVVASAGNDATGRPMFPAAFAPNKNGPVVAFEANSVPVVSVGALNPDGTVALFSNSAPWVLHWEVGAAVVSTMPAAFDYGVNAAASTTDPVRGQRAAVDPDRFRGVTGQGGFAVWSGTSFAAPVLAGRLAQHLVKQLHGNGGTCTNHCRTSVDQGWAAVQACCPPLHRPPAT